MSGWSKGLTKHTDPRVAKMASVNTRKIDIGECGRLYWEEEMTLTEISSRFGLSVGGLWKKFTEAGIPMRSRKQALRLDRSRQKQRECRKGIDNFAGKRPHDLGRPPWNKGLTIEDPRVAKNVEALREGRRCWGTSWNKGKPHTPKHSQRLAELRRNASCETKRKWLLNLIKAGFHPNKQECKLQRLLDFAFPGEWKYVGDGSLIIGGCCPDFVNINGEKILIEFFGEYWHPPEDEMKRKQHFGVYGFSTIVIWGKEMGTPERIIAKIKEVVYGN